MEGIEWYTREEAETSEKFGSIPENRSIDKLLEKGMVIVDKPFGPTSQQISTWVRKELDRKKTGHFGTLDPNATGVLTVGLNNGTRLSKALSKADKEYIFEAKLGEKQNEEKVRKQLKKFLGTNKQVPPDKSAVKQEEREREVYEIELLDVEGKNVLGRVRCESGFYVRVLISQLGKKLGTEAEMAELRRTQQGKLTEKDAYKLQDIVDAYHFYHDGKEKELRKVLYPIEKAVNHLKKIVIKDSAVNAVANGAELGANGVSKFQERIKQGETVALMTLKGELVALGSAKMNSEQLYEEGGTAATLKSVHMTPKTYPKRWKQD